MNSDQLHTFLTPSVATLHFDIEFLAVGVEEKEKEIFILNMDQSFKMKY